MQFVDENSTQMINESYKIWKKNVPCLYNVLQTYQLASCSQTIDWFTQSFIQNSWRSMNLLIGTNSISNNALYKINIHLPTDQSLIDTSIYNQNKPENDINSIGYVGTMGQHNLKFQTTLVQNAQIMKAKICKVGEYNQNLVAVKIGGSNPEMILYNFNYQDQEIQENKLMLKGHESEGYGLNWNNKNPHYLASCSYDRKICVWDISKGNREIDPLREYESTDLLEQIKWIHGDSNVFAVGSQNKQIFIYDIRENTSKPAISKSAHNAEIFALDFNRFCHNLLLSGCENGDIYMWDIRNMSKKLNSFIGNNDAITTLQWSNQKQTQFLSGSADRKIISWDMQQLGKTISQPKNGTDKKSQINFIHNGHRSRITDICYSPEQNVIASCQQNNIMQVWQVAECFLEKD